MTSTQAQKLIQATIKNDPQSLRPFILFLYGLRESRGDPAVMEELLSDSLGFLYFQTGEWEEKSLKDYVSLAA